MKKGYALLVISMFLAFVGYSQTLTLPISENFEGELQGSTSCNGAQVLTNPLFFNVPSGTVDGQDWTADQGGTGSGGTGPSTDYNPGTSTGKYLYVEASNPCFGDSAFLVSNYMNWSTVNGAKIEFWYHMLGQSMGTLHFDIRVGSGAWTRDYIPSWTDDIDLWQLRSISIVDTAYAGKDSIQIRLRGMIGPNFYSDMSIDDVSITPIVANNITADAITSPSLPIAAGASLPTTVDVINSGTATVTSFTAVRTLNGVVDSVSYTGTLLSLDTVSITFPATTFNSGSVYDIEVYTKMPNGMADEAPADDTARAIGLRTAMAGAYTINPGIPASATNFPTFADFGNAVSAFGISAPVTVAVSAGTYNESILLDDVVGSSTTNTITISGQDSVSTIINGTGNFYTIALQNASYITIERLGIVNNGTSTMAVLLTNGSTNNTVQNCEIRVSTSSTSSNVNPIGTSSSLTTRSTNATAIDMNTIENNRIIGGYYGVYFYGGVGNYHNGNRFAYNDVDSTYLYGAYFYYTDNSEVIGNNLDLSTSSSTGADGFYSIFGNNFTLEENYIYGRDYGAYFSASSFNVAPITKRTRIVNNMIIAETDYGLRLLAQDSVDIWYNSVTTAGTLQPALMIEVDFSGNYPVDDYDVRNNIFYSENTEAVEVFRTNDTIFAKFDNNLYHTVSGANLFTIDGTAYTDLVAYQTASPLLNISSVEGDPLFLSPTDLHIIGVLANDSGDASVPVFVDIDGDVRPAAGAASTDIGADEFDPPLCVPAANQRVSGVTLNSAYLVWDGTLGADYQYIVVNSGDPQTNGTPVFTSLDSVQATGLNPSTAYDFYVRVICGRGDTSLWIGPFAFNTANGVPYLEDFESFPPAVSTNPWPRGWSSNTASNPRWESEDANNGNNENSLNTGPLWDHTFFGGPTNGMYIYLETSGGAGNRAEFVSPPIQIDSNLSIAEVTYWYSMYGATMGTLTVMADTNGVRDTLAVYVGQQQTSATDPWLLGSHFLTGYNGKSVQLVFEGLSGTSYTSDMAIDDVAINPVLAFDAGVTDVVSPSGSLCPGPVVPEVEIRNFGSATLTNTMIYWDINGTLDSLAYTGSIAAGEYDTVALPAQTIMASTVYDITFYTGNVNGNADQLNDNDSLSILGLRSGLDGVYTINAAAPASATNFQSFSDFADAISTYGTCGPVDVDVVAGSGPYNDQLNLDGVRATASEPVIIHGNSETIEFGSTNASLRAVVNISNSSYITIDSLVINGLASTYSWGVHITDGSDHISITNSDVTIPNTSTSTFYSAIQVSGSRTSSTTQGTDNHITIDNNFVSGGYYGITMNGSSLQRSLNNVITNNRVEDFYAYGIYTTYMDSSLVELNDIERAVARTSVTTFYGIYMFNNHNSIFNRNAIYNSHGSVTASLTGTCYPIYATGDAAPGNDNYVINNLVYDINGNGTIYGIYDLGSDGMNYINNTISLDHTAATGGITRGIYQSNVSTNSSFINNIITVTRGGTGTKHGIYFNNAAGGPVASNYNNVYMNAAAGTQYYGRVGTNDYLDLAAWAGATTYGANSHEVDPQYNNLALDSLIPSNGLINAVALPSPVVTEDYYGVPRGAGPDIGAIQFDPPPIDDIAMNAMLEPFYSVDSCYSATEEVIVRLLNSGGNALDFTVNPVTVTTIVTGAITDSLRVTINNNAINGGSPLALGSAIEVSMGNINMAAAGTYSFRNYTLMTTDAISSNDTLLEDVTLLAATGGTVAGSDTICDGDTTTLSANNYQGTLQWQVLSGGMWMDIMGETSPSIDVAPTTTTSYRVIACGSAANTSDTLTIVPLVVSAPTVSSGNVIVTCGATGTDTLIASGGGAGAQYFWYDAPVGGNQVNTGDTLLFTASTSVPGGSIDTFYVSNGSGTPDTLVGELNDNNGCGSGNMFDLLPKANLEIVEITGNSADAVGGPTSMNIYIKSGTYVGFENQAAAWTLVATATGTSAGAGNQTTFTLSNPISLTGNQLTGMYLEYNARYANIAAGTVYTSVNLDMTVGAGHCSSFSNGIQGRAYSGRLLYTAGCASPRVMAIGEVDCVVGIEDVNNIQAFSITPNPSNGLFNMNIQSQSNEAYNMTIRDVRGTLILDEVINTNGNFNRDFDLSDLSKGVYYIRLQSETESIVEKIVIQ